MSSTKETLVYSESGGGPTSDLPNKIRSIDPQSTSVFGRITHRLHALELAESSDAREYNTEHHTGRLGKVLSSNILNFKFRTDRT